MAEDLQQSGFAPGGRRLRCTVKFSDIRGFTSLCEKQPPEETIELLDTDTQWRVTYTCIGDTVNMAARRKAHTKGAGREILVDAAN